MSSVSSLNHLTVKGGVPLNAPLKRTVALGRAAWDSGSVTKLGGSEENNTDQVKEILTFDSGLNDQSRWKAVSNL